jgi:hypothetical protein
VNLESHKVVDLLPGREAETSAAWMGQQPDLMVVIVEVGMPKPRRLALHKPLRTYPKTRSGEAWRPQGAPLHLDDLPSTSCHPHDGVGWLA